MLQQGGNELGHLQKILLTIMFVLVVLSFTLCITCFGYLLGKGEPFKEALSFTVVLLVASIPIAIEIVCTTTLALGSRELSAHGAIVTRLAAIEDMAGMNMLCSDKTGTLTLNQMVIQVGGARARWGRGQVARAWVLVGRDRAFGAARKRCMWEAEAGCRGVAGLGLKRRSETASSMVLAWHGRVEPATVGELKLVGRGKKRGLNDGSVH